MAEKKKINGKSLIGDILKINPKAGEILMENGMHCLGCSIASGESLEEAAMTHGISVEDLLKQLNN